MRWLFRIFILIIVIIALAIVAFIWLAQARGLQQTVEDNLVLLKRDLILDDRNLSFSYQSSGVEMKGLSPAYTLVQPILILTEGNKETRFTASELSFVGGFTSNQMVTVTTPNSIQMTQKDASKAPRNLDLYLTDSISVALISSEGQGHLWEQYKLKDAVKGTLRVEENEQIVGRVSYQFPKFPASSMPQRYSPSVNFVINRINVKVQ